MAMEGRKQLAGMKRETVERVLRGQRLPLLIICFLALLTIFFWLLRTTPEGQRWLVEWRRRQEEVVFRWKLQAALKGDPPLGFS